MKCLKPGGVVSCTKIESLINYRYIALINLNLLQFGVYEWVMTDAWDPSIPSHKAVAHGIEVGDGIAEMRNTANARNALVKVGFQIEHEEDLADREDEVPWYYPLEGDVRKAQTAWDSEFEVFTGFILFGLACFHK